MIELLIIPRLILGDGARRGVIALLLIKIRDLLRLHSFRFRLLRFLLVGSNNGLNLILELFTVRCVILDEVLLSACNALYTLLENSLSTLGLRNELINGLIKPRLSKLRGSIAGFS